MKNNKPARYPFTSLSEGTFFFITDFGAYYSTEISPAHNRFKDDLLNNDGHFYEISFYCTPGDERQNDESVAPTILHIISSNIISKGDTATYFFVCDTTSGKGKARAKLFDLWYMYFQKQLMLLEKHNFIIPGFEEDEYYVSLLIYNNHPAYEKYLARFEAILSEDFSKS